jgi:hypothetical protein
MHRNLWRALATLTALLLGLGLAAVPAQATATANVNRDTYQSYTQDRLFRCTVPTDGGNHGYDVPRSVQLAAMGAQAPAGYHRTDRRAGSYMLTGNGLPTVRFVANHPTKVYITLSTGVVQQTWRTKAIRRAWVPGYAGSSCSTWTLLQWAD